MGFDSPSAVIERLLDFYESKPEKNYPTPQVVRLRKPELIFYPSEDEFKENLLEQKRALVSLHKSNGTREIVEWKATRFSSNSSLRGNLWSGLLRNWETKGIIKAELSVNMNDLE